MNSGREYLRPQTAMNKPFLKPDGFESSSRHSTQHAGNKRITKSSKANLSWRCVVRIRAVARRIQVQQDQQGFKVGLKEDVTMNPLSQVAAVADVARYGIEGECWRQSTVLNVAPCRKRRHVIDMWRAGLHSPVDRLGTERCFFPEELGDVWTETVTGAQATKQNRRCDTTAGF